MNNNIQILEYDEMRTCRYCWVEEVDVVLPVIVTSKMVACDGRNGRLDLVGATATVDVIAATASQRRFLS